MFNTKSNKLVWLYVCIGLIVNILVFDIGGLALIRKALTALGDLASTNSGEVKKVVIESEGYISKSPGSWHMEKSAEWTSTKTAKVAIDIDTIMRYSNNPKDVFFVIDISGSMNGAKLDRVKQDVYEITTNLLSNNNNQVALVTFESSSQIVSPFTKNEEEIKSFIDGLEASGNTNYHQALVNVDKVLSNYKAQKNRDVVVLFLTDGYPNEETPNEVADYYLLKDKYNFLIINAVQYEMGQQIVEDIINMSDNQFYADMNILDNVLFEAALNPDFYEKFEVVDYIDNDYFEVLDEDDISVTLGNFTLSKEGNSQKITWTVNPDEFRTGSKMHMDINLNLLPQYIEQGEGYYPTNKSEQVTSKLFGEDEETVGSKDVPVLKSGYKVYYEGNYPRNCDLVYKEEETHYYYEAVELQEPNLECEGYVLDKWEIVDKVDQVNDDYFIMPDFDVHVKGVWTKLGMEKSMDGEVYKAPTLYNTIKKLAVADDVASDFVANQNGIDFHEISSETNGQGVYMMKSSAQKEFPIYYYRGNINNNNLLFADFCWKIVRTTETGGIKIIYNGKPQEQNGKKICNNTGKDSQLEQGVGFNDNYDSLAYVGYKYGTVYARDTGTLYSSIYGSSATYDEKTNMYTLIDPVDTLDDNHHYSCSNTTGKCSTLKFHYNSSGFYIKLQDGKLVNDAFDEMFQNNTDSRIKDYIENTWYEQNMTKYTQYLEDTVWCNDREFTSSFRGSGWNPDGGKLSKDLVFDPYARLYFGEPSLACSSRDSLTVKNKALKYPVGLITTDELMLAGGQDATNRSYYLYTGEDYWTMSPSHNYLSHIFPYYVLSSGTLSGSYVYVKNGVRPMVSLKPDIFHIRGNGNPDDPYIVVE